MKPFDLAETDRLLSTTRAVRKRLDLGRPVPRDGIVDCIRLSQQAPTGSNGQGWRWVVVTDADKRRALADLYRRAGGAYLAASGRDQRAQTDAQYRRVYDSAMYLLDHLHEVPVHVIPCIHGKLPAGTPAGMAAGFYGSIFPAVWSFMLALRSRGLGSVITTIHLGLAEEVAALLQIPDGVTQAALLPVAYTTGDDFRPAARRPASEITYWNTWKQGG